jgi:hypothetical protein
VSTRDECAIDSRLNSRATGGSDKRAQIAGIVWSIERGQVDGCIGQDVSDVNGALLAIVNLVDAGENDRVVQEALPVRKRDDNQREDQVVREADEIGVPTM